MRERGGGKRDGKKERERKRREEGEGEEKREGGTRAHVPSREYLPSFGIAFFFFFFFFRVLSLSRARSPSLLFIRLFLQSLAQMLLRRVCSALSSASLVPLAPVVGRTPLGLAPRLAAATLLRSSTSTSLHGDASLRTVSTGQDSSSKEPKRPDAVGVALERLRKALPNLVNESCDLDFYTDDIVLENTISGMTLRGRTAVNVRLERAKAETTRNVARLTQVFCWRLGFVLLGLIFIFFVHV